jgi:SAM-dependent methyltransferase
VIRSLEPELMDSADVRGPVLDKFHRDLNFVNKYLGTFPTLARFIRNDAEPVRRVLDIGCGGGALLEYLRRRLGVEVIGVDPEAARYRGRADHRGGRSYRTLPEADVAI